MKSNFDFILAMATVGMVKHTLYPEGYFPYLEPREKENKKRELSTSDLESIEKAKQKQLRKSNLTKKQLKGNN